MIKSIYYADIMQVLKWKNQPGFSRIIPSALFLYKSTNNLYNTGPAFDALILITRNSRQHLIQQAMIKHFFCIAWLIIFAVNTHGQSFSSNYPASEKNTPASAFNFNETDSQDTFSIRKERMIAVISAASVLYLGSMSYLQFIWYKDDQRVPFHFHNDLKGYNQIDKFGHMYGAYMESYIGFHSLLWAGVPRKKAVLYGGSLGFFMQLPIEIWDGLYEGWGFSWSDVGANTLGTALVIGQELAFREQIVKYKLTFSASPYAQQANGYLGDGFNQLFYDYNGHTYWLSVGINRLIKTEKIPDWLNIAVGYSAGGMFGEFRNLKNYRGVAIPETERFRQFLFSFDIDFTKIPARNKNVKALLNSLFMVKIPFPALELNTKGQLRFYPLYF